MSIRFLRSIFQIHGTMSHDVGASLDTEEALAVQARLPFPPYNDVKHHRRVVGVDINDLPQDEIISRIGFYFDVDHIKFWSAFSNLESMPHLQRFSSISHLVHLAESVDVHLVSLLMRRHQVATERKAAAFFRDLVHSIDQGAAVQPERTWSVRALRSWWMRQHGLSPADDTMNVTGDATAALVANCSYSA